MPAAAFRASLSEDAGARSGFALDEIALKANLAKSRFSNAFDGDRFLRFSSEDYDEAVGDLLFALGTTGAPGMPTLIERFIRGLDRPWQELFELDELMRVHAVGSEYLRRLNDGRADQASVREELFSMFKGKRSEYIPIMEIAASEHLAFHPTFTVECRYDNRQRFETLFLSEEIAKDGSQFFDQRFINYLAANPQALDEIHWRQFEYLAAEWLDREGYQVQIGPGRNDGSVDLRAWTKGSDIAQPPAIIAQCKRTKEKIPKIVVKALWADMNFEKATSGLIVTTSDISPGAQKDILARRYPITTANRLRVVDWVLKMRNTHAGIVVP